MDELTFLIGRSDTKLNIFIYSYRFEHHVLAYEESLVAIGVEVTFNQWHVFEKGGAESFFDNIIDVTQLTHVCVEVYKMTILVIERHGYEGGVKHLDETIGKLVVTAFLLYFIGYVLNGTHDVANLSVFSFFCYSIALY